MSETERDTDHARLERYFTERTRAQAQTVQASIASRFRVVDPARCMVEYEVSNR